MTVWSFSSGVPEGSSASAPGEELLPGSAFGPYAVLAPLGEGGSSRVYRARGPQGEVALKVLRRAVGPEEQARFRREGQLAAALRHEGLVALLDGGEVGGVPFLAYELVPGATNLLQALAPLGLAGRVRLLRDVARAVGFAHARGVVHRDLTPGNVLVDAQGRPRVADFGLALVEGVDRLTRSGAVVGTPLYMAPEQTDPEVARGVGPTADVWSLGVMLYQAISGRHPFPATSWLELRRLVQSGTPPSPRSLCPAVTPALEAVCQRALAVAPAQRLRHGEALAAALDAALAQGGLPADPASAPPLAGGWAASTPPSWMHREQELGRKGRFELRGVLGKGGMGVVYLAWDPELQREVALKMVSAARGTTRLERFRREGEVTASLKHPGILGVHSVGVLEETPFIVYELVRGARTLREVARELDQRRKVELVRDVARALAYAHERGVVHRDVKPENVLVDAEGRVRVADFGLAAVEGQGRLTHTGAMVGTPYYMAPELIAGQRDAVGPHTDAWALGVVLFELLAGRLPFEGNDLVALASRIIGAPAPSPRALVPDLDRRLEAICQRALTRAREQRYPSAREMADDLDAFLAGRPLSGSTSSLVQGGLTPGRRGLVLLLLAPPLLALLVALGVTAGGPDAPPNAGDPAPATNGPAPPASGSAAWVKAGDEAWKAAQGLTEPGDRLQAGLRWLEAWPSHPGQPRARAGLEELRRAGPLRVFAIGPGQVRGAFRPDGRLLTWTETGAVACYDPASGRGQLSEQLGGRLGRLVDTPWGIVLGSAEGRLFKLSPEVLPEGGWLAHALARSPDGRLVFTVRARHAWVFEAETGRLLHTFPESPSSIEAAAFSPDARRLALAGGPGGMKLNELPTGDATLSIWEVEGWARRLDQSTAGTVRALCWSPTGETLLLGYNTGQLQLVDAASGALLHELQADEPGKGDRVMLRAIAHEGTLRGAVITPDGRRAWSASQGDMPGMNDLRAWDLTTLRPLWRVPRPYQPESLALSPDGRFLAVGTNQGKLELWAAD